MHLPEKTLRLCLFHGVTGSMEIADDQLAGTLSNGPRYQGPLSEPINMFIKMLFGPNHLNYTSVLRDDSASFNTTTGYWHESTCYYSMQMNESDYGIGWTPHPLVGRNLEPLPVYMEDNIYIVSRYIVSNATTNADFVESLFDIFYWQVWLCVLVFCFIFWTLMKLNLKFVDGRNRRDDSLYELLTHLFQVESIDYTGPGIQIVSFCVTFLSFFFFAYFTNLMRTNIILVKEPDIIRTYDDLLNVPHARILFPKLAGPQSQFEFADPEAKERKLWDKAMAEAGGDKSKLFIQMGGSDSLKMVQNIGEFGLLGNITGVMLINQVYQRMLRETLCRAKVWMMKLRTEVVVRHESISYMDTLSKFYCWSVKDPDAREYILTWARSSSYKGGLKDEIDKRITWAVDMGLNSAYQRQMARPAMKMDTINNHDEGDFYRSCLADDYRDNLPFVPFAAFSLKQYNALLKFYAWMLLVLPICVVFEMFWIKYMTPRKVSPTKMRPVQPRARTKHQKL